VISGDGEHGERERAEESRRALVLIAPPAVRQVARRDDELGPHTLDQGGERALDVGILARAEVQVRHVEDSRRHGRSRLIDAEFLAIWPRRAG
jgi:hypothetical protein